MTVKSITFAAIMTVVAGGSAMASGNAQMAATLGVNANDYSLAQLVDLHGALEDNDASRVAFILAHKATPVASASATTSAGNLQRAALLGVEGGKFTSAELTQLELAKRANDTTRWDFIVSGTNRTSGATAVIATNPNEGNDN